jgi:hypothetical protein
MEKLGIKVKGREAIETNGRYQLRRPVIPYEPNFTLENGHLGFSNTSF